MLTTSPHDSSPRADNNFDVTTTGDDSELVSHLVKSFIELEVSRVTAKESNENSGENEAGEYAATLEETPQSPRGSEELSDGQAEEEIDCQADEATTPRPEGEVRPPIMRRGSLADKVKTYRPLLSPPSMGNRDSVTLHAERSRGLGKVERQLYQMEEKVLREMEKERKYQEEEQRRHHEELSRHQEE